MVGGDASPITRTSAGPGAAGAGRVPKRPDQSRGFTTGRGRGMVPPAGLKLPVRAPCEQINYHVRVVQ
eukprot:5828915-Pyramimonas_sp.AAC.1